MHWRADRYPLEDTIEAFGQLQREGKILAWGVSNFEEPDLQKARRLGGGSGSVCNQVHYHLQERAVEHAVIPWCRNHDTKTQVARIEKAFPLGPRPQELPML